MCVFASYTRLYLSKEKQFKYGGTLDDDGCVQLVQEPTRGSKYIETIHQVYLVPK